MTAFHSTIKLFLLTIPSLFHVDQYLIISMCITQMSSIYYLDSQLFVHNTNVASPKVR